MFNRTGRPKEKPKVSNRQADFALKFGMITREEYDQILKGNMDFRGHSKILINLNANLPYLASGETTKLYQGRAEKILIDRLLDRKKP